MIRVIAELGVNHGGSFEEAIRLQSAAADAGCWAVKYQMRTNFKECVPEHLWESLRIWRGEPMTYLEYRKKVELSHRELLALRKHAKSIGLEWFASVWDRSSVGTMAAINREWVKVPSAMLTNENLLHEIRCNNFRTVFLSTGMSTQDEIFRALKILGNCTTILMACVSAYPAFDEILNVRRVETLQTMAGHGAFGPYAVGYSGHETDILPSLIAVGLGATYIERHLTMDKTQEGSDHAASLEPQEMAELVRQAQRVESMLGDGTIKPLPEEEPAMRRLRPMAKVEV